MKASFLPLFSLLFLASIGIAQTAAPMQGADECTNRVLAMNEIARGWQERALAAEAELARLRIQSAPVQPLPTIVAPGEPTTASTGLSLSTSETARAKTVSVRGYTRKDGTYVRPYTRSAPLR